jgi:hypothetical protein
VVGRGRRGALRKEVHEDIAVLIRAFGPVAHSANLSRAFPSGLVKIAAAAAAGRDQVGTNGSVDRTRKEVS